METYIIFLICGLFNITFLICGYKLGTSKQIITITKGDKVEYVEKPIQYEDFPDEEATYVTPEEEREYEAMLRKQGDTNGMAT